MVFLVAPPEESPRRRCWLVDTGGERCCCRRKECSSAGSPDCSCCCCSFCTRLKYPSLPFSRQASHLDARTLPSNWTSEWNRLHPLHHLKSTPLELCLQTALSHSLQIDLFCFGMTTFLSRPHITHRRRDFEYVKFNKSTNIGKGVPPFFILMSRTSTVEATGP